MSDATQKPVRGGARPGAGRPKKDAGRKFAIYLPAEETERLAARAKADGVTTYAWIVKTIQDALKK